MNSKLKFVQDMGLDLANSAHDCYRKIDDVNPAQIAMAFAYAAVHTVRRARADYGKETGKQASTAAKLILCLGLKSLGL